MLPRHLLSTTKSIVLNTVCITTRTCLKLPVRDSHTALSLIPRGNHPSPEQRNCPSWVSGGRLSWGLILPWAHLLSLLLLFHYHLPVQANNVLFRYLSIAMFCWAALSTENVLEDCVQVFTFLSNNMSILLPVRMGIVPRWNGSLKSKTPKKYMVFYCFC